MSGPLRISTFSRTSIMLAAQYRGFLDAVGLTVQIEPVTGSRQQMADLIAGRHDIAHTNADNIMRYRAAGHPELYVFLVLDRGIAQKLVVAPQVSGWADLRGATVGVDAPDSGYAFVLYELLRRHGIEPGQYNVRALGATGLRLAALRRGEVAAAMLSHHHEASALDGGFRVLAASNDHFADLPGMTAATTRSWAGQHKRVLSDYTAALVDAAAWAIRPENHEDVVRLVADASGLAPAQARRLLDIETGSRTGVVTTVADAAESLARTAALRRQYTGAEPSGYFDPSVLAAAFERRSADR
ncbi:MAG: ABC transporter substrate-binding protein [Micromonosporaceae bacterium]|nr:ABC transporter substrate-binding protein [Micromonosporaceae bacterium]